MHRIVTSTLRFGVTRLRATLTRRLPACRRTTFPTTTRISSSLTVSIVFLFFAERMEAKPKLNDNPLKLLTIAQDYQ